MLQVTATEGVDCSLEILGSIGVFLKKDKERTFT
jgi:hypothetical protein